jgi:hypothetical protein
VGFWGKPLYFSKNRPKTGQNDPFFPNLPLTSFLIFPTFNLGIYRKTWGKLGEKTKITKVLGLLIRLLIHFLSTEKPLKNMQK